MAVPEFQTFMLPILQVLADGEEHRRAEVIELVAQRLELTESDRAEKLPSGKHSRHAHRTSWAIFDLLKAEFVERPSRGVFRITQAGRAILQRKPSRIDLALLKNESSAFRAWRAAQDGNDDESAVNEVTEAVDSTPEEQLDVAYRALRAAVEAELLSRMLGASPTFLETTVVDLLVAMGYGGSLADAGQALGRSGDEGVDGIIKEDKLGLDVLYVQAKRWAPQRTVGRPDIQQFAGSLAGQRARKGVFITTSSFSHEARDYVTRIDAKIVLIDGAKLASLMFDHDIGVRAKDTYTAKEVDEDAFDEE